MMGCKESSRLAPIDQLEQPPDKRISQHKVLKGDTLYSIAWRYSMDYREIATLNNIRPPYTIYVGQKLDLGQGQRRGSRQYESGLATGVVAVPDSGYTSADTSVREISGVREISSPPAATGSVNQGEVVAASRAVDSSSSDVAPTAKPAKENVAAKPVVPNGQWMWPANGRLVGRFSSGNPLQKGIDIEGSQGAPVIAAAAGSVVYAGNGLAGYGELVIVKHNETFLSAYAHNSKLLVAEGEQVKAGQAIAEMGSSGTDKTKLHFEIRQAGKPVDPLLFLPNRQ